MLAFALSSVLCLFYIFLESFQHKLIEWMYSNLPEIILAVAVAIIVPIIANKIQEYNSKKYFFRSLRLLCVGYQIHSMLAYCLIFLTHTYNQNNKEDSGKWKNIKKFNLNLSSESDKNSVLAVVLQSRFYEGLIDGSPGKQQRIVEVDKKKKEFLKELKNNFNKDSQNNFINRIVDSFSQTDQQNLENELKELIDQTNELRTEVAEKINLSYKATPNSMEYFYRIIEGQKRIVWRYEAFGGSEKFGEAGKDQVRKILNDIYRLLLVLIEIYEKRDDIFYQTDEQYREEIEIGLRN